MTLDERLPVFSQTHTQRQSHFFMMKLILEIEPKPQSRPRFARRGNFTTTYEDKDMKSWRNNCQLLIANQYMGQPILEGALRAKVRFYIKPPQYISKVKKNQQALLDEIIPVGKKPDIDNYEKALYDSMSEIVFKDDGQIALHDVGKFYSLNPRIEVEVNRLNHEIQQTNND